VKRDARLLVDSRAYGKGTNEETVGS
jgi:hypothetical protein